MAEVFNDYFVEKIDLLKSNIDQSIKKDPLEILRKKMEGKCINKFTIKKVSMNDPCYKTCVPQVKTEN